MICEHGFDLRRLHLPETTELKKDALTCHMWAANTTSQTHLMPNSVNRETMNTNDRREERTS